MLTHRLAIGIVLLAAAVAGLIGAVTASTTSLPTDVREVRVISVGSTWAFHPFSMTFSSVTRQFVLVPVESAGRDGPASRYVTELDFFGKALRVRQSPSIPADSVNVAVDKERSVLYYVSHVTKQLMEGAVVDGVPTGTSRAMGITIDDLGIEVVDGMAFDTRNRQLYLLDALNRKILRLSLQSQELGKSQDAHGRNSVTKTIIEVDEKADLRGMAFNPADGYIYVMGLDGRALYVLDGEGKTKTRIELSDIGLMAPRSMLFAASGDLTDEDSRLSLYVVDGDGDEATRIVELAFAEPLLSRVSGLTADAPLVQIIDTSELEPPSPDPAGLAFISDTGILMMGDSEVNEMPIYEGTNIFEILTSGDLVGVFDTTEFSDEPTGIAYKPYGRRLYFTDDSDDAVYEVGPGADGAYGTIDDVVTSFSTRAFNSHDPEGIAYEGIGNRLFLVDGVNAEVYEISPGPNGVFDGVDDHVTQFDTEDLGLLDPEGIEYNPDTGNLYIVGEPEETVFEVTTVGDLVRTIDISEPDPRRPAGLAYGPRSNDVSVMSLYVVDRGVDNNTNPEENDGKVYEFGLDIPASSPTITPTPTNTPTPTATATSTPVSATPTRVGNFDYALYFAFITGGTAEHEHPGANQLP